MAMDMGSRYGTWLNGQKMVRGLAYVMDTGTTVFFGDDQEFRAVEVSGTQYTHTAAGTTYGV
jgi:pSer/pThr/pTyr-binding forkhead associated (FHA) protein